jgi:hypothetical protein
MPSAFAANFRDDRDGREKKWAEVARDAGIKPE